MRSVWVDVDIEIFWTIDCTEVRFASFLSGGFTTMAVINPLERKLVKRISVYCIASDFLKSFLVFVEKGFVKSGDLRR